MKTVKMVVSAKKVEEKMCAKIIGGCCRSSKDTFKVPQKKDSVKGKK